MSTENKDCSLTELCRLYGVNSICSLDAADNSPDDAQTGIEVLQTLVFSRKKLARLPQTVSSAERTAIFRRTLKLGASITFLMAKGRTHYENQKHD
jgi:hypothetical protein